MADVDKHSKTEQPTGKRLNQALDKGVPQSRDLTASVTLIAAMVALYASGGYIMSGLKGAARDLLGRVGTYPVTEAGVHSLMLRSFLLIGAVLAPFLLTVMLTGLLVSVVQQQKTSINWERISFDLNKLNPLEGFKRLLNLNGAVEGAKSFLKILLVGYIAYRVLRDEIPSISYLTESDLAGILAFASHISYKLVIHTGGVLLILGVFDLIFLKWQFVHNIKMTKEEVKQEHKETEGDPKIKGKIRRMQYEMARKRLKQIIPTADVIITNPTHFAVALKYDRQAMGAPVVIAKGADNLALRIKEIARESKVMLVENRFLARELYALVKEGDEIPESLYAAVAEILAYVYSLKGKL